MCCTTSPHRSPHLQRQQIRLLGCVVGAVGTPHGPTNQASVHHQLLGGAKNLACTGRIISWKRPACSIEVWGTLPAAVLSTADQIADRACIPS